MPEEAFKIPPKLLLGAIGGVILIGFLIIFFVGFEGLSKAWCELNPQFCNENLTSYASDDVIARNSVLALKCAINSVANNEINDRTCPESRPEYGARLKLEGGYPETEGIRRCYGSSCAVCRLPEIKKSGEPTITQISLGGVYNSSDGLNWTNIGAWSELGNIKFLVNHKDILFAAGGSEVFRLDQGAWKSVFSSSKQGIPTHIPINSFIEHNGSLYLAFRIEGGGGLYKSSDKGGGWTQLEAKDGNSPIKNIENIISVDGKLFLLKLSKDVGTELYRSLDDGLTWKSVGLGAYATDNIKNEVSKEAKRLGGTGVSGDYISIGDRTGEGVGNVKKIIKVGQDLFAASEITTGKYSETTDKSPFIEVGANIKSGGVYKSTDGGDNWARIYYGDVENIIEFNKILYVFDRERGVIAYDYGRWDIMNFGEITLPYYIDPYTSETVDVSSPIRSKDAYIKNFKEYNGALYAVGSVGVFKLDGAGWIKLANSTTIGAVNNIEGYGGSLVVGSSEVTKVVSNTNQSLIARDSIWNWMKSKYRWLTNDEIPGPITGTFEVDYCKVENFNFPQKIEEYRFLGIDWNPANWIFGYGDPKYMAYWQSFPQGEDASWRSHTEWMKNIMFVALTSCFRPFQTLKLGNQALRKTGEKVGATAVKKAATQTTGDLGEGVASVSINAEGQVLGQTATVGIPISAAQAENVLVYTAEKGTLQETRRKVIQEALESAEPNVREEVLQKAEKQAAKAGFKDLKTAAKRLGFGTPLAFIAAWLDSWFTNYESFGNSLVFKYHSQEPFKQPEPFPLDIQPGRSTAFVEGKEKGNYKEWLRPVVLDKGLGDAGVVGSAQNWLTNYLGKKNIIYKTIGNDIPVDIKSLYLAAPCHTDLQVGDTIAYCRSYRLNPSDKSTYCDLITGGGAKTYDYCGVVVKDGAVIEEPNADSPCSTSAIRVSSVNRNKYDEEHNFCYSKTSYLAEAAAAATILGSIGGAIVGGPVGACTVGLAGGLLTEWLKPDWPD